MVPHATEGSLKHLEINDNFFNSETTVSALCEVVKSACKLEHLNIDSSSLEDDDLQNSLVEAIKESEGKASLKCLSWNYDAFEKDDFIKELLETLGDKDTFPELKRIELRETMEKKRNQFRKEFLAKDIKLVLSDRQMESDEDTDSEEDSDVTNSD